LPMGLLPQSGSAHCCGPTLLRADGRG